MLLRLRVTYSRTADFLGDVAQQVSRRGLLVRVAVDDVERGVAVELELVTPVGRVVVPGSVLQPLGAAGVAVELDPARLHDLVEQVKRSAAIDAGPPPLHERVTGANAAPSGVAAAAQAAVAAAAQGDAAATTSPESPSARRAAVSSESAAAAQAQAQKIQLALHGDKNQRMAILREPNKLFHGYVLKNPQLQLEEVVFIARMPTTAADSLAFIAGRREWAERPEVALALVRNPKTPVPLAIRMLDHVAPGELRVLAKQQTVREQIQRAARKKILG